MNQSLKGLFIFLNFVVSMAFSVDLHLFKPLSAGTALAETLTMGYRTSPKAPYIAKEPVNSGLYFDLYSTAAKKLNCEFKVVRKPKKRIFLEMKKSIVDFYPGLNFTEKRTKFTFYIENGLPGGDIGISLSSLNEITDLNQLKGKTLLVALGGPDFLAGISGVKEHFVPEMTTDKAVQLIRKGRGDFYIYEKSSLNYYIKKNFIKDLKLHPNCCGGVKPLYLGFAKASSNIREIKNPNYDASQTVGPDNFPTILDESCLAARLAKILAEMKASGETNRIYDKYFK